MQDHFLSVHITFVLATMNFYQKGLVCTFSCLLYVFSCWFLHLSLAPRAALHS